MQSSFFYTRWLFSLILNFITGFLVRPSVGQLDCQHCVWRHYTVSTYVQIYSNSVRSVSQGHAVIVFGRWGSNRAASVFVLLLVDVGLKFTIPEKLNPPKNRYFFVWVKKLKAREMKQVLKVGTRCRWPAWSVVCWLCGASGPAFVSMTSLSDQHQKQLLSVISDFSSTLMHFPLFIIFLSYSPTCFEQYCAHHQEDSLYTYSMWFCHWYVLLSKPY